MIYNFIPAMVAALLCYLAFRIVYARTASKHARFVILLMATILAVPAVLIASSSIINIPNSGWFWDFRSYPDVEIMSGLLGALAGVGGALLVCRRFIIGLYHLLIVGLVAAPFVPQVLYRMDYSQLEDTWVDDVCMQSSSYTCLPASVTTVMRLHGDNVTEKQLAREMGTSNRGTDPWYAVRVLKRRGYDAHWHTVRSARDIPVGSIMSVNVNGIPHVVVLIDKSRDKVTVRDPLEGYGCYEWNGFIERYSPNGSYLEIRRGK